MLGNLKGIKACLGKVEQLELELSMKQLQLNRLLNITQAINNNAKEAELFDMYKSFMQFEMQVPKVALFIESKDKTGLYCAIHLGLSPKMLEMDVVKDLANYNDKTQALRDEKHPYFNVFEYAIPVKHKETHIAYAFVAGINQDLVKLQLITAVTNVLSVAIENKRLFKKMLDQQRITQEIELASAMQRTLVPNVLPTGDNYSFASIYKPHRDEVGGDFFDCNETTDKVTFCVADIAGKGLAAALLMANALAILRSSAGNFDNLIDFVRDFNKSVYRITQGDRYLTMFYAEWESTTRILRFVNAGHVYPMLVTEGDIKELVSGTTILGAFDDLYSIKMAEVHIPEEATLFAYTDGLTDIVNEEGDMFNEDKLKDIVKEIGREGLSATAFNTELMKHVNKFRGEADYTDDLTILTCKIHAMQD